jgi:hypothetical protein
MWSKLPSLDWRRYLVWQISPFLQLLVSNREPYLTALHHHATVGSLPLKPIELSLIDNLTVIKLSLYLEPMATLFQVGPPLHCAPLVHHVARLLVTPP